MFYPTLIELKTNSIIINKKMSVRSGGQKYDIYYTV